MTKRRWTLLILLFIVFLCSTILSISVSYLLFNATYKDSFISLKGDITALQKDVNDLKNLDTLDQDALSLEDQTLNSIEGEQYKQNLIKLLKGDYQWNYSEKSFSENLKCKDNKSMNTANRVEVITLSQTNNAEEAYKYVSDILAENGWKECGSSPSSNTINKILVKDNMILSYRYKLETSEKSDQSLTIEFEFKDRN